MLIDVCIVVCTIFTKRNFNLLLVGFWVAQKQFEPYLFIFEAFHWQLTQMRFIDWSIIIQTGETMQQKKNQNYIPRITKMAFEKPAQSIRLLIVNQGSKSIIGLNICSWRQKWFAIFLWADSQCEFRTAPSRRSKFRLYCVRHLRATEYFRIFSISA